MIIRRCSLWSPCSYDSTTVALMEERMKLMGVNKECYQDNFIYYKTNSRQSRPLLRFNTTNNTFHQISLPDTNAARKCTSEVITMINVGSSVDDVHHFLTTCKYSKLNELRMSGMKWTILGCTLEAISIDESANVVFHLHTTASGQHHGSIASAEDRLFKVANYLSDIISLKHIDNSIIKQ